MTVKNVLIVLFSTVAITPWNIPNVVPNDQISESAWFSNKNVCLMLFKYDNAYYHKVFPNKGTVFNSRAGFLLGNENWRSVFNLCTVIWKLQLYIFSSYFYGIKIHFKVSWMCKSVNVQEFVVGPYRVCDTVHKRTDRLLEYASIKYTIEWNGNLYLRIVRFVLK